MTRLEDAFDDAEDEVARELEQEYLELTDPATGRRETLWHLVDGGLPFVVFYAGYQAKGVAVGAEIALAVAVLLATARLYRGERLLAVGLGALGVAVSSAVALSTGEGRNFFVTGMLFNAVALLVTVASVLFRRPVTGEIGQRLGREEPTWRTDPARRRVHLRMTLFWAALWASHLAVTVPLFLASAVGAMTLVSTFVLKPSILLWLVISFAWGERSKRN